MTSYEIFLQLHYNENPLLLGNAWNVTSAKTFERCGFKAIATSSRAIAHTLGYEDGENMGLDLLLETVKRIINHVKVPLSVDIESGYSRDVAGIIRNIERLYDLGVVGFNIEDSIIDGKGEMQPVDSFQKVLSSIRDHLEKKNMNMYVNARTDAFLHKQPSALIETIKRIKAYEAAGTSGIFVPFISNKNDIGEITQATLLPLNVLTMPGLPGFKELAALGVKRISMGSSIHDSMTRALETKLETIKKEQSAQGIFQ